MINYDDFSKIELRVVKIIEAERVEGSDKLIKLQVEAGDVNEGENLSTPHQNQNVGTGQASSRDTGTGEKVLRQIVAGIGKQYNLEDLIGKQIVIVANLEPRSLMGVESNGMLLAASDENGMSLIVPDREMEAGSRIK